MKVGSKKCTFIILKSRKQLEDYSLMQSGEVSQGESGAQLW